MTTIYGVGFFISLMILAGRIAFVLEHNKKVTASSTATGKDYIDMEHAIMLNILSTIFWPVAWPGTAVYLIVRKIIQQLELEKELKENNVR